MGENAERSLNSSRLCVKFERFKEFYPVLKLILFIMALLFDLDLVLFMNGIKFI